jgi:hypothetical protein
LIWERTPREHKPTPQTRDFKDKAYVIVMGSAEGTGRPNQSKIFLTADRTQAYAFVTWNDMFGYSVKESAPQRHERGSVWRPLIELNDTVRDLVIDELDKICS